MRTIRKDILIFFIVAIYDSVGNGISWPSFVLLSKKFTGPLHSSDEIYFSIIAIYSFFQAVGGPLLAFYSDKFGYKKVIIFSLSVGAIDNLFSACTSSLASLYTVRAICGLLNATTPVVTAYLISAEKNLENSEVLIGRLQACGAAGMILGPIVGGALTLISSTTPFLFMAFCSIVLDIFVFIHINENYFFKEPQKPKPCITTNIIHRSNYIFIVIFFLITLSEDY